MNYAARVTDPETSHWAQDSITGVSELQADILRLFRQWGPMTDEQLIARHDVAGMMSRTPERIRTARHELEVAGRLGWSGTHEPTVRGRKARVWELPPSGTLFDLPPSAAALAFDAMFDHPMDALANLTIRKDTT